MEKPEDPGLAGRAGTTQAWPLPLPPSSAGQGAFLLLVASSTTPASLLPNRFTGPSRRQGLAPGEQAQGPPPHPVSGCTARPGPQPPAAPVWALAAHPTPCQLPWARRTPLSTPSSHSDDRRARAPRSAQNPSRFRARPQTYLQVIEPKVKVERASSFLPLCLSRSRLLPFQLLPGSLFPVSLSGQVAIVRPRLSICTISGRACRLPRSLPGFHAGSPGPLGAVHPPSPQPSVGFSFLIYIY